MRHTPAEHREEGVEELIVLHEVASQHRIVDGACEQLVDEAVPDCGVPLPGAVAEPQPPGRGIGGNANGRVDLCHVISLRRYHPDQVRRVCLRTLSARAGTPLSTPSLSPVSRARGGGRLRRFWFGPCLV